MDGEGAGAVVTNIVTRDLLAEALADHNAKHHRELKIGTQKPQRPEDPWRLDLSEAQVKQIKRDNHYLWKQLVQRGFIDQLGKPSDRWKSYCNPLPG